MSSGEVDFGIKLFFIYFSLENVFRLLNFLIFSVRVVFEDFFCSLHIVFMLEEKNCFVWLRQLCIKFCESIWDIITVRSLLTFFFFILIGIYFVVIQFLFEWKKFFLLLSNRFSHFDLVFWRYSIEGITFVCGWCLSSVQSLLDCSREWTWRLI